MKDLIVKVKENISTKEVGKNLSNLGYTNVSPGVINKEGEFSIRGGVVDVWLERYKLPIRLDLIGEEIEDIYTFNILTQKKVSRLKEIYIVQYGITPKIAPAWTHKKEFPSKGGRVERLFLSEVKVGDLVVHIDHGIGKFVGFENREGRNLLSIEYAKGDKLFVPVEQIERVTKYIGAAGYRPRLNNLGTAGWEKIRSKVAQSIVKSAKELLTLYAKREMVKRHPFSPDTPWQKQLENSFEFSETEDQSKTTKEIKKDLESSKPMDRLLVGDVGFGKTEVAIRASFKVIQDGFQVAILVPTTILAEQHFHLFKERLKEFPIEVGLLSRFRSEKEQKDTVSVIKTGKLDIVIGTHRLLSKDVGFSRLGLLIIDEEHRFGVSHKESIKELKTNVDVLSMSATPIPRTLHMSLAKIRDMSTLSQPPQGRKAIETRVGEYSEEKIVEVINKEVGRGGQVYYLFNSVAFIAQKTRQLEQLWTRSDLVSKKIRFVYAHGRMSGSELEDAMDKFYSRQADVLVCTTIIGSGLDMPNVNTIIIEDAQRFGLSDLHQLRGRVGRSERQAFAYLFYPKGFTPKDEVLERLTTMATHTELGAGFQIAKKDLEIRGAGNLLGTAQSGNIALVGFELYVQLLNQTVERLQKK